MPSTHSMSLADHLYEVREDSSINHKVRIFFIPVVPPFWMMAKMYTSCRQNESLFMCLRFDPTGKQYRAFERVIDLLYLHIVWIVCLGMFAAVVACAIIMVVYDGRGIYSGLCPAPTPCVKPCIVEADPDIAGVGVGLFLPAATN